MDDKKPMNTTDPNTCHVCGIGEPIAELGYLCQGCHDDGWRAGQEMVDAIRKDKGFLLDRHGRLHVNPLEEAPQNTEKD